MRESEKPSGERMRDDSEMSLEARLWREVCHHLELEESAQRLLAVLAEQLPSVALLIRRIDRDPGRLTTVAVGSLSGTDPERWPARTPLDGHAADELLGALAAGQPLRLGADRWALLGMAERTDGQLEARAIALPLLVAGEPVGLATLVLAAGTPVGPEQIRCAALATGPLGVAFENDRRIHELARLGAALEADREALLTRLQRQDISEVVIGARGGLATVMERVQQVAPTDAPVLVLGETGSGKEVIARAIHGRSSRSRGPVVRVNCGAIPAELVDSELFGHERGAFTGATGVRKGWFERADGGTLFLDEVGELPLAAQVRLLRVLQDGTLERVGGSRTIHVDVRIVAATHRHLEAMVADRTFREDLWYRLSVFPIRLPALRERLEDLPALASYFAERAGRRLGGAPLSPSESEVDLLRRYPWPGNVRELASVIERATILGNGKRLEIRSALGAFSPPAAAPQPSVTEKPAAPIGSLDEAMADHIRRALTVCQGRIEGPAGAAELLAINPHTLRARMRKLGVQWQRFRPSPHGGSTPGGSDDGAGTGGQNTSSRSV